MKTNNSPIQLNENFMRLVSGAATLSNIITERNAERSARLAREDAYSRRHREMAEAADAFGINYCR